MEIFESKRNSRNETASIKSFSKIGLEFSYVLPKNQKTEMD